MSPAETAGLILDAPDETSIAELVERLAPELGEGAELEVGRGSSITIDLPSPPRYIVTATAAMPGVDDKAMRRRLKDTLTRLGVRYDNRAVAETLDLTVVFL